MKLLQELKNRLKAEYDAPLIVNTHLHPTLGGATRSQMIPNTASTVSDFIATGHIVSADEFEVVGGLDTYHVTTHEDMKLDIIFFVS